MSSRRKDKYSLYIHTLFSLLRSSRLIKMFLGNMTRDAPTPLQNGTDLTPRNPDEEDPLDLPEVPLPTNTRAAFISSKHDEA